MREIKFRAWKKSEHRMLDWFELKKWSTLSDVLEGIFLESVMQYTGLKDSNGVEIYEGDVLGDIWANTYIQWCPKCCSFELISNSFGCLSCSRDVFWDEIVRGTNIEVIGNIYSNPELLEDK